MISLLVPTRGRPVNMERIWQSAIDRADRPGDLEVIYYIDLDDDISMAKFHTMESSKVKAVLGPRVMLDLSECMYMKTREKATGPYFWLGGDDNIFRTAHWDTKVLDCFDVWKDKILMVYGRDEIQNRALATHPFIHDNWIKTLGHITPDEQKFIFTDLYITRLAYKINRAVYLDDVVTEHMHSGRLGIPQDMTYEEKNKVMANQGHLGNITSTQFEEDARKLLRFIREFG